MRIVGSEHPRTLEMMHELAVTHQELEEVQRAKRCSCLGCGSLVRSIPARWTRWYQLALTYKCLGHKEAAKTTLLEAEAAFRRVLGEDPPQDIDTERHQDPLHGHSGGLGQAAEKVGT